MVINFIGLEEMGVNMGTVFMSSHYCFIDSFSVIQVQLTDTYYMTDWRLIL